VTGLPTSRTVSAVTSAARSCTAAAASPSAFDRAAAGARRQVSAPRRARSTTAATSRSPPGSEHLAARAGGAAQGREGGLPLPQAETVGDQEPWADPARVQQGDHVLPGAGGVAEAGQDSGPSGSPRSNVTHDQTEAMTLGTRVAVISRGVLQQVAPPQELYQRPANLFVAASSARRG